MAKRNTPEMVVTKRGSSSRMLGSAGRLSHPPPTNTSPMKSLNTITLSRLEQGWEGRPDAYSTTSLKFGITRKIQSSQEKQAEQCGGSSTTQRLSSTYDIFKLQPVEDHQMQPEINMWHVVHANEMCAMTMCYRRISTRSVDHVCTTM